MPCCARQKPTGSSRSQRAHDARDLAAALTDEDVARIDGIDERRRIVEGFDGAHWNRE